MATVCPAVNMDMVNVPLICEAPSVTASDPTEIVNAHRHQAACASDRRLLMFAGRRRWGWEAGTGARVAEWQTRQT